MNSNSDAEVDVFRKQKCAQFRSWPGYAGSSIIRPNGESGVREIEIHENSEERLTEEQRAQIREALSPLKVHFLPSGPFKAL